MASEPGLWFHSQPFPWPSECALAQGQVSREGAGPARALEHAHCSSSRAAASSHNQKAGWDPICQ